MTLKHYRSAVLLCDTPRCGGFYIPHPMLTPSRSGSLIADSVACFDGAALAGWDTTSGNGDRCPTCAGVPGPVDHGVGSEPRLAGLHELRSRLRTAEGERDAAVRERDRAQESLGCVGNTLRKHAAELDALRATVARVEALRDQWEAAIRDPTRYRDGGAEHAAALAASHLPALRDAIGEQP